MSESLNIIRTGSEPTNQGSIGFDLGDGVTEWIVPDTMAEYVESIRYDPRRWKIVALDDSLASISATWDDVLHDSALRTRLSGASAILPAKSRVMIP